MFGLTAAVDDLSLTYWSPRPTRSPLRPDAWAVDLAGLAVSADIGGITLAGGLRKFAEPAGGIEYLGMLMARFGGLRALGLRRVRPGRAAPTTSSRLLRSSARSTARSAARRPSSSPASAAASASTAA